MVTVGIVYLIGSLILIANHIDAVYAQMTFIVVLSFPLWMPSFGRFLCMDVTWDQRLIRWFKKEEKMPDNVYNLPKPKLVPPMPNVAPVKPPAQQHYSIGVNSNRDTVMTVYTSTGSITLTMNDVAVQQLIKMLEASLED
jgi:hypothetical protein